MSATKGISKVPNGSKQFTKMTPVSSKIEWRIENFQNAMRFYKSDQSISIKKFVMPRLQAVWQLDVYPGGTSLQSTWNIFAEGGFTYPYFYLRLIGFQSPDCSLSTDGAKTIMADYKIYLLSSTNEESMVKKGFYEFEINSTVGTWVFPTTIPKFIHPDGSLLVICEIESLTPEETFSMGPTPNPELLDPNLRITDRFKEMWKSQLFSDCTIKVRGKSFPAHKCILGQWSEVFQKMFLLPTEEAKSGIVDITDFSPNAISAMLEYMYTGVVKKEVMDKWAMEILALADKYAVFPLKDMCEVYLAFHLTTENFLEIIILADRYLAAKLKKACVNRLAIDGRAALQSKMWEDLKSKNKDLADEMLELLIKDHPAKS